jgi:hypothetical protein
MVNCWIKSSIVASQLLKNNLIPFWILGFGFWVLGFRVLFFTGSQALAWESYLGSSSLPSVTVTFDPKQFPLPMGNPSNRGRKSH